MRRLLRLLPLLLVLSAGSRAADGTSIKLTITPIVQDYCRGDDEYGFARIRIRLTVLNRSESDVLLCRGALSVERVMLASSEQAFLKRAYLLSHSVTAIAADDGRPKPTESDLTRLSPGESRAWVTSVRVPLRLTAGGTSPGEGDYWLGVTASGSPPRPFPKEWDRKPEVFLGSVTSSPAAFRIEASPKFGQCR